MRHPIKPILFLIGALLLVSQGIAQINYMPYYGKSKVMYQNFQWETYPTDHYDIYYYTGDLDILKTVVDLAESAYVRTSQKTKHQLSAKVPLLYYKTFTDFQQTNLYQLPEGVLGVSEPLLYRLAVHGDMPLDDLEDLIEHELAHIFEYDLLWGSPGGALYAPSRPPDWIFEGFSEYNTENWASWSKLIVRDAVLNDRIPEMTKGGSLYSRYPMPRGPDYEFGHAMFDYIEHEYGKNGVRNFWQGLKNAPLLGRTNPIKRIFHMEPEEFQHDFKKWIREQHKEFLFRDNPEDYSITMGPQFPMNEYWFAFSHAPSPSGDLLAVVTYSVRDYEYDILLISLKDGKVIRNLTKGYTLKYEYIKMEIEPSNGRDVAWSPDGDTIAFFARSGEKSDLFLVDAIKGKIRKRVKLNQDRPTAPCFLPENNELLFTAFEDGIHDIFKVNIDTGNVLNLTRDDLYEKAPIVSPDGRSVAYSLRVDTFDKLFISPINNLQDKTQLTFGRGNDITPTFSLDSKTLYYSGDIREAYNIYSVHLETGEIKRYTDVRTGNFFPTPLPGEDNQFVFASFNKGSFQIFKSELEGETEKTVTFVKPKDNTDFARFEPILSLDIDEEKIKPYKGLGDLYMAGRPPIDTIVATDGSFYGGSALNFADLFHDHTFTLMAYQVQSFRSYNFSYLNQKRRVQWMASAYQYTQYYYTPYSYLDPSLYYRLNYQDAIATRTITGINLAAFYPFNQYYRVQASFAYGHYSEDYYDPYLYQASAGSYNYFWNGSNLAASVSLTGETTSFRMYGPYRGNTFRVSVSQSIPIGNFLHSTTMRLDLRHYLSIGADTLFAFRFDGFASRGENPYINYFGGNNTIRSSYYYSMIGNETWYANVEFRFPIVTAALTLLGQIGPVRGTFFFDIGRTKLKGYDPKITVEDFDIDGETIIGYRAVDAIGSYGFGMEFFLLGFPIHIDFVKALDWPSFSKPFDYNVRGNWQTKFWIGFDF